MKGNKYNISLYPKLLTIVSDYNQKLHHNCFTTGKLPSDCLSLECSVAISLKETTKKSNKYNFLLYPKLLTVVSDYNQKLHHN